MQVLGRVTSNAFLLFLKSGAWRVFAPDASYIIVHTTVKPLVVVASTEWDATEYGETVRG